jgi:hypothetical protein
MGIQRLPAAEPRMIVTPDFTGVTLTGLTLRSALDALVAVDPRYEWREMSGVIVFRPATAWVDSADPLNRLFGSMRHDNVPVATPIGEILAMLGAPEYARNNFSDSRRISVDLPAGSALDHLNGLIRSHGEMCWQWGEMDDDDFRRNWSNKRHELTFSVFNSVALGFSIP